MYSPATPGGRASPSGTGPFSPVVPDDPSGRLLVYWPGTLDPARA
jgi:hypothetical protein